MPIAPIVQPVAGPSPQIARDMSPEAVAARVADYIQRMKDRESLVEAQRVTAAAAEAKRHTVVVDRAPMGFDSYNSGLGW